jgi:hypothetical protein
MISYQLVLSCKKRKKLCFDYSYVMEYRISDVKKQGL